MEETEEDEGRGMGKDWKNEKIKETGAKQLNRQRGEGREDTAPEGVVRERRAGVESQLILH